MNPSPSDDELHAYVDGHLDDAARLAVEQYLAGNPARAAQVRDWQQDAHALRGALARLPMPADNPELDPTAIRARRGQRARARLALAASLVVCLTLGALGGWQARGWQGQAPTRMPMSDAIAAYRLMVFDRGARVDIAASTVPELQAWLDRSMGASARLPDLADAGFTPMGGRLFATESGPAAMVLYQDAGGQVLSFYLRPPESSHRMLPRGERADGGLLTRYGSLQGLLYAVVGPADSVAGQAVGRALDGAI